MREVIPSLRLTAYIIISAYIVCTIIAAFYGNKLLTCISFCLTILAAAFFTLQTKMRKP